MSRKANDDLISGFYDFAGLYAKTKIESESTKLLINRSTLHIRNCVVCGSEMDIDGGTIYYKNSCADMLEVESSCKKCGVKTNESFELKEENKNEQIN